MSRTITYEEAVQSKPRRTMTFEQVAGTLPVGLPIPASRMQQPEYGGLTDEVLRGSLQEKQSRLMQQAAHGEDVFAELSDVNRQLNAMPVSKGQEALSQARNLPQAVGAFVKNPMLAPEIATQSGAAVAQTMAPAMGAAGGALGALARTPVVGAAVQAGAYGLSSYRLSASEGMMGVLRDEGIDTGNPEALKAAFSDKETLKRMRSRGLKYGLTVGAFDALSAGIAGRLFRPALSAAGKIGHGATEMGVQMLAGGAGEAAGQKVSGQPFNIADIVAEVAGELGTAPIEVATGAASVAESARQRGRGGIPSEAVSEQDLAGGEQGQAQPAEAAVRPAEDEAAAAGAREAAPTAKRTVTFEEAKEMRVDREETAGIPSEERVGEEPVQAQPVERAGGAAVEAGGVVQEASPEITAAKDELARRFEERTAKPKATRKRIRKTVKEFAANTELDDEGLLDEMVSAIQSYDVPADKIDDVVDAVQARIDQNPERNIDDVIDEVVGTFKPAPAKPKPAAKPVPKGKSFSEAQKDYYNENQKAASQFKVGDWVKSKDDKYSGKVVEIDEKFGIVNIEYPDTRIVTGNMAKDLIKAEPTKLRVDIQYAEGETATLKKDESYAFRVMGGKSPEWLTLKQEPAKIVKIDEYEFAVFRDGNIVERSTGRSIGDTQYKAKNKIIEDVQAAFNKAKGIIEGRIKEVHTVEHLLELSKSEQPAPAKPKPAAKPTAAETKPAAKAEYLDTKSLPEYAQRAIIEDSMMRRTNEGGGIDSPDPYQNVVWKQESVSVESLKEKNPELWGDSFQHRGSVTKGAIVVNDRGEIIDGNNRLFEAIKRGDKSIDAYRAIKTEPTPTAAEAKEELRSKWGTDRAVAPMLDKRDIELVTIIVKDYVKRGIDTFEKVMDALESSFKGIRAHADQIRGVYDSIVPPEEKAKPKGESDAREWLGEITADEIEGEIVSITKAHLKKSRETFGYKIAVNDKEVQAKAGIIAQAGRDGANEFALAEAMDIIARPRGATGALEIAGMLYKKVELIALHKALRKRLDAAQKAKDKEGVQSIMEGMSDTINQMALIDTAVRLSTRESGRAISMINSALRVDDLDLTEVLVRIQKMRGIPNSPEIIEKVTKAHSDYEKARAEQDRLEREYDALDDKELKAEADRQYKKARAETKTKGKERAIKRRQLGEERLRGLLGRANDITGAIPEAMLAIKDIALGYAVELKVGLDGVVDKIQEEFPEVTDRDVWRSFAYTEQKQIDQAKREVIAERSQIQSEARLLDSIWSLAEGTINKPSAEKRIDIPRIAQLRKLLHSLRNKAMQSKRDAKTLSLLIYKINEGERNTDSLLKAQRKNKRVELMDITLARQVLRDMVSLARQDAKLADLEEQIRTGNIKPRPKPIQRAVPKALRDVRLRVVETERTLRQVEDSQRELSWGGRAFEALDLTRTFMASYDLSGILNQGGIGVASLMVNHPARTLMAVAKSVTYLTQKGADKVASYIRNDHKYPVYLAAKLDITRTRIGNQEEYFANRLISGLVRKYPAARNLFAGILASENHMTSFLNMLRKTLFDDFYRKYPNATAEDLRAWASMINPATGRGDSKSFGLAGKFWSKVFFSARFAVSRVEIDPLFIWTKYWAAPHLSGAERREFRTASKKALKEYNLMMARASATALSVLALLDWGFDDLDVEWDITDPDFLLIRWGNTKIDLFGGRLQVMRLPIFIAIAGLNASEITKIKVDNRNYVVPLEAFKNFVAYKFAPIVTLPYALLFKRNIMGQKVTRREALINSVTPFIVQAIMESEKDDHDIGKAVGVGAIELIGGRANTYKRKSKATETSNPYPGASGKYPGLGGIKIGKYPER